MWMWFFLLYFSSRFGVIQSRVKSIVKILLSVRVWAFGYVTKYKGPNCPCGILLFTIYFHFPLFSNMEMLQLRFLLQLAHVTGGGHASGCGQNWCLWFTSNSNCEFEILQTSLVFYTKLWGWLILLQPVHLSDYNEQRLPDGSCYTNSRRKKPTLLLI